MDIRSFFVKPEVFVKGGTKRDPTTVLTDSSKRVKTDSAEQQASSKYFGGSSTKRAQNDAPSGGEQKKTKLVKVEAKLVKPPAPTPAPKQPVTDPTQSPPAVQAQPPAGGAGGDWPPPKPDCSQPLATKTFVVSGEIEDMTREEAEDFIKRYGGRVTGSVSGKTSYLVLGDYLEDRYGHGQRPATEGSKYRAAMEKKVKVIKKLELYQLVQKSYSSGVSMPAPTQPSSQPSPLQSSSSSVGTGMGKSLVFEDTSKKNKSVPLACSGTGKGINERQGAVAEAGVVGDTRLWADKHKPANTGQLLGNQSLIRNLMEWLKNWEAIHTTKTRPMPKFNMRSNTGAKAVLISGPPGIGKSSAAALVGRELGFEVQEYNASDARSKKLLEHGLKDVLGTSSLLGAFKKMGVRSASSSGGGMSQKSRGRMIVMDEVDGMGAGDRGGMAALITMIKTSKTPIVCICNDRQSQKVRSLAGHCFDLRFSRPQVGTIVKRLQEVARAEGMQCDGNALSQLLDSTGNDIRQALNLMQMWGRTSSRITFDEAKARQHQICKDELQRVTSFQAASGMFNPWVRGRNNRGISFRNRYEAFFVDYDMIPLMVQEKYINSVEKSPPLPRPGTHPAFKQQERVDPAVLKLEQLSRASDAACDMELLNAQIRKNQNWSLLPTVAGLVVRVGYESFGNVNCNFPAWLGKNSAIGKRKRLLAEMAHHMSVVIQKPGEGDDDVQMAGTEEQEGSKYVRVGADKIELRMHYLPLLTTKIAQRLGGSDGKGADNDVEGAIALMDTYGLSRDDVFETMHELSIKKFNPAVRIMQGLSTKAKTAFTRTYNKKSHTSQGLGLGPEGAKKGAVKKEVKRMRPGDNNDMDDDEEEEEEGDFDVKAFRKQQKGKGKTKAKAKSKAKPKKEAKPKTSKKKGKGKEPVRDKHSFFG